MSLTISHLPFRNQNVPQEILFFTQNQYSASPSEIHHYIRNSKSYTIKVHIFWKLNKLSRKV